MENKTHYQLWLDVHEEMTARNKPFPGLNVLLEAVAAWKEMADAQTWKQSKFNPDNK